MITTRLGDDPITELQRAAIQLAIKAMNEIGIDISGHRSKSVDEFEGQNFDYVITVCDNANQQCPMFPGSTQRIQEH